MTGPRAGSLFSGGGGLDLAVETLWPGTSWRWHAEVDRHALTVHGARWPDVPNLGDLSAVDWAEVPPVDVLLGGYPCQPWSNAGKKKGQDDDRDGWPWFRDVISHLRPDVVLLENVSGHVVPAGAGRTVGDLADLGYDAVWTTLRASDVGAPHRRTRWFCVAYTDDVGCEGAGSGAFGDDSRGGPRPAAHLTGDTGRFFNGDRRAPADPGGVADERFRGPGEMARTCGPVEGEAREWERGGDAAPDRGEAPTDWGVYEPAIRRWEHVLNRPAPAPRDGEGRLSPAFVEWMMGWPAGHVDGVPRTAALRVLGNGVVPQQAVAAYAGLLAGVAADELAAVS